MIYSERTLLHTCTSTSCHIKCIDKDLQFSLQTSLCTINVGVHITDCDYSIKHFFADGNFAIVHTFFVLRDLFADLILTVD